MKLALPITNDQGGHCRQFEAFLSAQVDEYAERCRQLGHRTNRIRVDWITIWEQWAWSMDEAPWP